MKKLVLKKEVITKLEDKEMLELRGGSDFASCLTYTKEENGCGGTKNTEYWEYTCRCDY